METLLVIALLGLAVWHVARSFRRAPQAPAVCTAGCALAGRCDAARPRAAAACGPDSGRRDSRSRRA